MAITGAHLIMQHLAANGVQHVFGYPGGCIMPLYDVLPDYDIQHILCRHEQGCALAADGYARSSGKLGVAIATSGPGATNLVTGVANAAMDSVPLLVITGQVPGPLIGTDAFQEVDVLGLSFGITKHSYLVRDASELADTLAEATELATTGRPGPVWIDISKDALLQPVEPALKLVVNQPSNRAACGPDMADLPGAEALLAAAERPLIYCGGGVQAAGALPQFRALLEKSRIPCVETLNGLGNCGRDYPWNLGLVGMHGSRAANTAVAECDLLIAIGARFDDRATGKVSDFAPGARILQLDIDRAEHNKLKPADLFWHGDLRHLLGKLPQPGHIQDWRRRCAGLRQTAGYRAPDACGALHGPHLLEALDQRLNQAFVSCDVGQHQMWVAQHMRFASPAHHLSSGGLGTMGFGLPAAIGAKLAHPEVPTICISGDGSIMMNIQELATLARYGLAVKIIVLDNNHLGLVRQQQHLFYEQRFSESELPDNPSFAAIAEAFNLAGHTISTAADMDSGLDWLLQQSGPALLHARIFKESRVWPMVPPGAGNHQMLEENHHA